MAIDGTQFSPSTIALVSALASSIVTIGITKALDLIQRRQEHKYSLQKTFFEKKLKMAEELVAYFYRLRMIYRSLKVLLEKAPDLLATSKGRDWVLSQMDQITNRANKLEEETKNHSYASPLYFDLEEMDRLVSVNNQIGLECMIPMFRLVDANLSEVDVVSRLKTVFTELFKSLETMKSLTDSAEVKIQGFIREVRSEMAKYRP